MNKVFKSIAIFSIVGGIFLIFQGYYNKRDSKEAEKYLQGHYTKNDFWVQINDSNSKQINRSAFPELINGTQDSAADKLKQKKDIIGRAYDNIYKHYIDASSSLERSLQNLLILFILGVILLYYKTFADKGIKIPGMDITIPEGLIYMVVSYGIVYTWMRVGLYSNEAIDSRLSLCTILNSSEIVSGFKTTYQFSSAPYLADSGFIDNFCSEFFQIFNGNPTGGNAKALTFFGLYGIYGCLFGFAMGTSLTSVYEFIRRNKLKSVFFYFLEIFTFLMFALSSLATLKKFPFTQCFVGWYWLWAGIFLVKWCIVIKVKQTKELISKLQVGEPNS